MSLTAQMRQVAQEVVAEAHAELEKLLEAANARIHALEARLGGTTAPQDETETAAKAPRVARSGRTKTVAPEPEPEITDVELPAADAKQPGK